MVLIKKSLRDLLILRWQSLSIILVVACGVALLAGLDMGLKSLYFTRDRFHEELNFADFELIFNPTDIYSIPDFSDIKGILKVEKRLMFPGTINLKENKRLSGVFIFVESSTPQINSFRLIDGKFMDEDDTYSVVIERGLAKYHGFKPGDNISIKVGEKVYDSMIQGVVITPEFMTGTSNPDFFSPGKGTLGVLFGNIRRNKKSLGFILINNLLFEFSKDADPEELKNQILEKMQGFNFEKIILKKEHFSYKYMKFDLDGFKVYIPAIIFIMGILSFTTTFIIYNRFITNQQKEIGTLLCLGYRRKYLLKSFILGAGILGSIGCVLGLMASLIVRNIFAYVQYFTLDMPILYTKIYPLILMKGAFFGIIITIIPPLLLLSKLFRRSPYEIIREPLRQSSREQGFLTTISSKLSFLSLETIYTLRNIIRQKWLSISTMICIGLSLGVAISYLASVTSIITTIKKKFNDEYWDLSVDFFYPFDLEDVKGIKETSGVIDYEPFIRKFIEIGANNIYKDSSLLGINPISKMKRIKLIDGRQFSKETKREIILNRDIAQAIDVRIGDPVEIKINQRRYNLKVVGISSEFAVGQSVAPFNVVQDILELPEQCTGLFLRTEDHYDLKKIKNALYKFEYVGRVTEKGKLLNEFLRQMKELMGVVHIATVFSIIVSIIFIYTNTNLIIFERKCEFALLRSLGYTARSIKKIIHSHIIVIGALGGVFSIPIAIVTAILLNQRFSMAWYKIENYFIVSDFIGIILVALILMTIMAVPVIKYIQQFEISEVIHQKNIE